MRAIEQQRKVYDGELQEDTHEEDPERDGVVSLINCTLNHIHMNNYLRCSIDE